MSSVSSASSSSTPWKGDHIDPILRNALRYTVSAREYKLLHRYLLSRAAVVKEKTPSPHRYEAIVNTTDDYNAAAIRSSVRLALSTFIGLRTWELISTKILARGQTPRNISSDSFAGKNANVRLSGSFGLILFFHRILYRFFARLRLSLLSEEARAFRRRNPRVSGSLTSRLAPAIGSSLAGFFLAINPANQLRITIAIYAFAKSLEFTYNWLEDRGWFRHRPWWFGSWMLMPAACGQLLHAFIFDRDCFPEAYGSFILKNSPQYVQKQPPNPEGVPWPNTFDIVDSLAEISRLRWPAFVSPILFPKARTLPRTLTIISPVTDPAHPATKALSCALLHPHDPSCLRTYVTYFIHAFPRIVRFFTIIFTALSLLRYKSILGTPKASLNRLAKSILKMSMFITGAIGTAWGSICFFQAWFPRTFLPTKRWFLGGAMGGMWAFLERKSGRGNFLYSARLSLDSLWKVGVKHGWWRGIKNGDVLLLVASLALINATYEVDPKAVSSGVLRKSLGMLRGEGWVDRAVGERQFPPPETEAAGIEAPEGEADATK